MVVHTAQYAYPGLDRLDITMNTKDPVGIIMAPTKSMVWGYKYKGMTEEEYTRQYYALIENSTKVNLNTWMELFKREVVTLVCYCSAGKFCHRVLMAKILEHWGHKYTGEKRPPNWIV